MSDRKYGVPCGLCGQFLSSDYPRTGLEMHPICERIELNRQFYNDAIGKWPHPYGKNVGGGRR